MDTTSHYDIFVTVLVAAGLQLMAIIVVGVIAHRTLSRSRQDAITLAKLIIQESLKIRRLRP